MIENPYHYYYKINNKKYADRLGFLVENVNAFTNSEVTFCIPKIESSFDSLNLFEEPKESLNDLYKQRAIQLRNDYDYIILFYSGGADSHCILETFLLNNIFIDELVIYDSVDLPSKTKIKNEDPEGFVYLESEGRGREIQHSAIPLAKHFIETYSPNTKITYFSSLLEEHLKFWKNMTKDKFFYNLDTVFTSLISNFTVFRTRNPNVFSPNWKKIKSTKKTVSLWGREKPAIKYNDTGFYFFFTDNLFQATFDPCFNLSEDGFPNIHEFFFIHPSCPKLFLKQAHVLVNTLPKYHFAQDGNPILDTRHYQNIIADVLYDFKVKIPFIGTCKSPDFFIDFKKNPERYPNLKNLIKQAGSVGVSSNAYISKFFINNPNIEPSINHNNFINFIYNNFFYKIDRKYMLEDLTGHRTTKNFYFKKFEV